MLRDLLLFLNMILFFILILPYKIVILIHIRIIITISIMHLFGIFNIKNFHIIMIWQISILNINHQFRYFFIFKIFKFIFFCLLIIKWSSVNLYFLFMHNILYLNIIQTFVFVKFFSIVCI